MREDGRGQSKGLLCALLFPEALFEEETSFPSLNSFVYKCVWGASFCVAVHQFLEDVLWVWGRKVWMLKLEPEVRRRRASRVLPWFPGSPVLSIFCISESWETLNLYFKFLSISFYLLLVMPVGMWDLNSPTRDQTGALCFGSTESKPLNHLGSHGSEKLLMLCSKFMALAFLSPGHTARESASVSGLG